MAVFGSGSEKFDLSSTLLPLSIFESQLEQTAASSHRIVHIAKSRHQQFPRFEVLLLIFDTPESIKDFLDLEDAPNDRQYTVLEPQQLVAVCLAGDEEVSIEYPSYAMLSMTDSSAVAASSGPLSSSSRIRSRSRRGRCEG
jgi:hypothetical protein